MDDGLIGKNGPSVHRAVPEAFEHVSEHALTRRRLTAEKTVPETGL